MEFDDVPWIGLILSVIFLAVVFYITSFME